MLVNTWSGVELTKTRWSFYYNESIGQPAMSFTDDQDIIEYFTEGQCHALAYELHKLRGWSLVMVSDQPAGSPDYLGHIFVVDSDAMAIDIKGRRTLEELQEEWHFAKYTHRFFSLKDFEYEMQEWDCNPSFDRDPKAKVWARKISDML